MAQSQGMEIVALSSLPKTWFIDIDGTVFKHNLEYRITADELLPGVREFWRAYIHDDDKVILVTNRVSENRSYIEAFFRENGLRFDMLISDLPNGERVCINDTKPSGLRTAVAINVVRNEGVGPLHITRYG